MSVQIGQKKFFRQCRKKREIGGRESARVRRKLKVGARRESGFREKLSGVPRQVGLGIERGFAVEPVAKVLCEVRA